MHTTTTFVGIDVSKTHLDLAIRPSDETAALPKDLAGSEKVVTRLRHLKLAVVVLEATGGLERAVVRALVAAALPVITVIRATSAISPERLASWPRRTSWMRTS